MTKSGDIQNPTVFGVFLQDERSISNKLLLGSIILSKNDMCSSCINLRQMINKELQSIIPQRFNFLTKEGWPLTDEQELKLKIYNIIDDQNKTISIKKTFDKPRIGIVNTNNDCIGFIYIDQSSKLFEIRQSINNLLNEVVQHNQQVEYLFIDKNGWPILLNQENELTLIDLVKNHCICIKPKIVSTDLPYTSCNSISLDDNKINKYSQKRDLCSPREEKSIESEFKRRSKTLINRTNTFVWRRKDKKKANTKHVIMLSYVRNEASIHAIKLKKYLVELGFSVFLDVHEIETGTDWADVLNEAVNACQVFVPLITPMYGKTQWTNREVKLADMLDKIIIPVNFLEKWPPSCLSIQFATIQVIHWKPKIEDSEHVDISPDQQKQNDSNDIRFWPDSCIQQVSVLIAKQTPKFEDDTQVQHKSSFLDKSPTTNNSLEDNSSIHKSLIKNKKPNNNQIVISAHPNQKNLADNLRKSLQKENYQVWCSTDTTSIDNLKTPNGFVSIDYPYPETPDSMISLTELQSLSTISESAENQSARATSSSQESNEKKSVNKIFNKNDLFIQNNNLQIVSSSSTATSSTAILSPTVSSIQKDIKRPTSLPITKIDNNNHFFTYEKRQIKRLPSQVSEISNYNTHLTPEKKDNLILFQEKVLNSKLVIIMISDAYFKSTTSKNHIYYCEHRKKMLLIKTDQTTMPTPRWFSNLVADEAMITQHNPKFLQLVKTKIDSKQLINSYHNNQSTTETKLQFLMKSMKKGLPQAAECCVYFLGSSKPISSKSEKICKALGVELSKIKNIVICSCGYGIGNAVAKSFYDNKLKKNSEPNVVSILPHKDQGDFSHICKQNKDKSFDDLDFGKTLFIGESMKERDKVVAKLLNTCVLIEGDLETVYQAEEFIWNDHHIIPVVSSGGAASGLFGLNAKCFNTPVGVEESDWSTLSDQNSTPEEIAKSICRIIIQLKKSILNQYILTLEESSCGKFKKSIKKKRIDDKLEVLNRQLTEEQNDNLSENSTPEKVLPVVENFKQNDHSKKNRWSKMQKYIWLSRRK